MPTGTGSRAGPIVAVALLAFVVGVSVYATLFAPAPRSLPAPEIPQAPPPVIEFGSPSIAYVAHLTEYGFNLTLVEPNVSWRQLEFTVIPGPLTGAETSWTLRIGNATSGEIYPFVRAGDNWTSGSEDPPRLGEVILLTVDSPLFDSALLATWPTLGPGDWDVPIG